MFTTEDSFRSCEKLLNSDQLVIRLEQEDGQLACPKHTTLLDESLEVSPDRIKGQSNDSDIASSSCLHG